MKGLRREKGLTQLAVAEKLGITPQAVSKWERGEALPDITLLPDIASMYSVRVEDILTAGKKDDDNSLDGIMEALNAFVDDRVFAKVLREFERAENISELGVPPDIFMALSTSQKDILLERLLYMDGFGDIVDDILGYLNTAQRSRLILAVAENGDYEILETLIPFMTRSVRSEVTSLLLERGKLNFLEEMALYLNREQKDIIIAYFIENRLDFDLLESFLPFFDRTQRKILSDWEELQ